MAAITAALACAMPANAQPSHKTDPAWLKAPSEEDLRGMWPAEAWRQQLGGKVRLVCEVDLQGLVQDCAVISEDPPGMGFGSAAMSLTPKFLFRPATVEGQPVTSRVTIPVNFESPGNRRSLKDPPPTPTGTHIPNSRIYTQPSGPAYHLTARPPWSKAPTEQQVAVAYPARAKTDTAFGHVVLACHFTKAGDLTACTTDAEEPKGQGFAAAARSLTPLFHIDPAVAPDVDLRMVLVNLAVHFTAPSHRQDRRLIDQPDWISAGAPSADLFPGQAARAGLTTGRAVLDCVANAAGKMTSCQVTSEDPAGMGFGAAALKTAEAVALSPWLSNGEPADGAHVVFAVRVNKDEPGPAPKP